MYAAAKPDQKLLNDGWEAVAPLHLSPSAVIEIISIILACHKPVTLPNLSVGNLSLRYLGAQWRTDSRAEYRGATGWTRAVSPFGFEEAETTLVRTMPLRKKMGTKSGKIAYIFSYCFQNPIKICPRRQPSSSARQILSRTDTAPNSSHAHRRQYLQPHH
ncbi:hypothetical protein VOLCADRAFT_106129 [Volvox carteri f. nagariensis]|uniref:Uncharacterized protein n=1 Tax=Volvox carteri f. nagariensis TaxID=3068 RepID=D8U5A3_VOLCA|nr:uncharacterized protein VOLCADRAFT_106129 [Volvox carteri f. nagariensis]EFJ45178.1 hypothetical protein VOLCADRAFT_106129 [Volvox carteri f. nagariensis]|eukprot:XP_002953854.1 hypothetical protein VOLCADRAFT_106129 [Volvox carteri f. nagariensis]